MTGGLLSCDGVFPEAMSASVNGKYLLKREAAASVYVRGGTWCPGSYGDDSRRE